MKKLLMILSLSLLSSGSATSNELSSINKLIENGYKIISEDIVSRSDSNRFIKTFTLQNKKSSLVICNITFGNDGFLDDYRCIKP
jgi:hypothetical protein